MTDTDQFPNDLYSMTLSLMEVLRAGGIRQGGLNFDAKVRRQSFEPEDLIHAHIGGVDLCARGFLCAARLIEEGKLDKVVAERYAGWKSTEAAAMLSGVVTLDDIAANLKTAGINPQPRSGRQEKIENIVLRALEERQTPTQAL